MRSAEGFISAPGIIALCRDWRLAPRQGNLHFPCDSLRCLPFCVPHESEHLALQAIHFHGVLLTVSGGDTIAIYHCSIKIVSRGKGKSAVAAAAYRAGEKLTNEWDGLTHDYTRKGGVVHSEIMLPPHAPPSFSDRSILWNSVEQIEKSNNSQLAREIEIALPVELSREEQTRLVREYCSSQFVSKGMCADFNIHDTGNGNPHAHILLTMRPLDEKGTWAAKSKKEYVLDENGERVKLPSGRYKTRKVDLMDWNRQENADLWRKAWADLANDYLERSGSAERIDHRSHAERGIEELPTVHMGVAASQMEKKGIATDKGEINRMIQKTNRLMREIRGYIDSLKEWLAEVFAAKKQLQAAPHSPDIATLLTRYLSIEREKSRKYSQGWQQQHTAGELQKISKAIVYLQSKGIANAVFVGRDESGIPRYAHQRGTVGSFRLDVKGSDKTFNFCYRGEGERLFVFEAPIDLLSFLCLFKKEWQKQSYLSLGGVSEKALLRFLSDRPNIKTVYLCLDSDKAGTDACSRLNSIIPQGYTVNRLVPLFKDWNEVLQRKEEITDGKYLREAVYGLREPQQEETVEIIRMSEVDTQTVEWLWEPYIPFGKVTIVQGNPGEGKTTLALRLCAACTNRKPFPAILNYDDIDDPDAFA